MAGPPPDFKSTPEQDARLVRTARILADALIVWAKERRDPDKQRVAALQAELCRHRHNEIAEFLDANTFVEFVKETQDK